jgi:hypothetical protein
VSRAFLRRWLATANNIRDLLTPDELAAFKAIKPEMQNDGIDPPKRGRRRRKTMKVG